MLGLQAHFLFGFLLDHWGFEPRSSWPSFYTLSCPPCLCMGLMVSLGTQGCWRVEPVNPYAGCEPGLVHSKHCHYCHSFSGASLAFLPLGGTSMGSRRQGFGSLHLSRSGSGPAPGLPRFSLKGDTELLQLKKQRSHLLTQASNSQRES